MDPQIWSVFATLSVVETSLRSLFDGSVLDNLIPLMSVQIASAGSAGCF